ncbi:MAG: methyltransferase domain-containing protein [Oscillospiraceae bacterium]|jgi:SAM-dependent methyltransferase|nr:methyltransferase domain-containing protein [Oscillospiraceae bacterium]
MPMQSLQDYFDFQRSPGGETQYRQTWEQLGFAQGLRVLDFGSGTGKTADHLAARNDVTAVEPSADMLARRYRVHEYRQIHGGMESLPDEQFDLALCHNVLEFVDGRERYLEELAARVKPGGRLSVVKHNMAGKALRQAVLYEDPAGALALLRGGGASNPFGAVRIYDTGELIEWAARRGFALERHCGVRAFYGMRDDNDGWDDPAWGEAAHELERYVEELEPYRSVAFYHHVVVRRA